MTKSVFIYSTLKMHEVMSDLKEYEETWLTKG